MSDKPPVYRKQLLAAERRYKFTYPHSPYLHDAKLHLDRHRKNI